MNSTKTVYRLPVPQISFQHGPHGSNAIFAGEPLEEGWQFEPLDTCPHAEKLHRRCAAGEAQKKQASFEALHASVWGKSFRGEAFVPKAAAKKVQR